LELSSEEVLNFCGHAIEDKIKMEVSIKVTQAVTKTLMSCYTEICTVKTQV